MTDEDRMAIIRAYCMTPPGADMPVPDNLEIIDVIIFVAHLEEVNYTGGGIH